MTEIIEPHPQLLQYAEIAYNLIPIINKDLEVFFQAGEWHYIQADIETNILLLKQLEDMGLLTNQINICDCGIGLGTVLFDLYLQSKEMPQKFTFTGVEKWQRYIEALNQNLIQFWNGELNLIHDDIMNIDYSNYNFIYFYQPFKVSDKAVKFYLKVIQEAPKDCLIMGLNHFQIHTYGDSVLNTEFSKLKQIKVDDIILFQK